jgi:2-keto-4-pentenoate hydratase
LLKIGIRSRRQNRNSLTARVVAGVVKCLASPVAGLPKHNSESYSVNEILAAAELIAAARRDRTPLAALPAALVPPHEADGYRIQTAVHARLAPEQGPLAGYKIGCTSSVMQQYLGIPHPCGGGVFASGVHASGVVLNHRDFVRVGVECEIAVRLGRDLNAGPAPFTAETVAQAIEAYHPAIEIVDDRYARWETLGAPTLIADDFFAAGCVLGDAMPHSRVPELADVVGRAIVNGVEVATGTGTDVLGHPHNALAWLANHLATGGTALRAGEIVLTGSLVKTLWLDAGDAVTMDLSGLGSVSVRFI